MSTTEKRLPRILFVARDNGGCGFYRCVQPANFLTRAGIAQAKSVLVNPTDDDLASADLVVMQESGGQNAANILEKLRRMRKPYVSEFDDFIHHISPNNGGGWPAWNPGTLYVHRAMEQARRAVAITVSTPWLAREYFPYNPKVYVVPNYLDRELFDNPIVRKGDGKVRIGWAGGDAHADDLHMIHKVISDIVRESDGKVVFETMGMTRRQLAFVFGDMKISGEVCPACSYEGELHHHPGAPMHEYPSALASLGWDIAVAPVIDNSFGNAKSDLKIKDYAAVGAAIVASNVAPYRDAAASGAQLLLAGSYDEWYTHLKNLIDDVQRRDAMTSQNKQWLSGLWIQDRVHDIAAVYQDILSQVGLASGK